MIASDELIAAVDRFPRVRLANTPTPIEQLTNLGSDLGISLFVKRDDYTGIAFGGNKVRQLEFYFGSALERSEGLFLDPTYTGKAMAGLFDLLERDMLAGDRVLFWHTGGQPALFAYADQLGIPAGS